MQASRRIPLLVNLNVFASGAVVMCVELTGSRLLAPIFGNSIYVWGSLIGVVLTALSVGYSLGGRLADRIPAPRTFATIVFTAGLVTAAIPYFSPTILDAIHSYQLDDRFGPLAATSSILLLPSLLMGMVSPFAVRLITSSTRTVGSSAGNVYSLSTLGSIVGTFTTVFIFIPLADVRTIILGGGLVLMAVSSPLLSKGPKLLLVLVMLFTLSPLGYYAQLTTSGAGEVIYSRETLYNSLVVAEREGVRTLYLNGLPHSAMNVSNPTQLIYRYTRFFELGLLATERAESVLFVGGGGFSGPKYFLEKYLYLKVDVVELDPEVIYTAKQFFQVKDDFRLHIINDDGRRYLSATNAVYDVVVLDAYAKTYVPFHLMTLEFFKLLSDKMSDDGVVVSNLIASLSGDTSAIFWSVYRTMAQVFPRTYIFRAAGASAGMVQNLIIMACKNPACVIDAAGDERLAGLIEGRWNATPYLEEYPILTDNYAPVESLINPVTGRPYSIQLEGYNLGPPTLLYAGSNVYATTVISISLIYWFIRLLMGRNR
ncbi:MAG: fused MFS/spermidine synthase [Nitrososphaerota archaeon]